MLQKTMAWLATYRFFSAMALMMNVMARSTASVTLSVPVCSRIDCSSLTPTLR